MRNKDQECFMSVPVFPACSPSFRPKAVAEGNTLYGQLSLRDDLVHEQAPNGDFGSAC
jgi:hypothetical protein